MSAKVAPTAPAAKPGSAEGDGKVAGRADTPAASTARPTDRSEPAQDRPVKTAAAPATQPVTPATPKSDNQSIAIAQRSAFLIQEPTPDNNNAVKTYTGTVVWNSQNTTRGSGQPVSFGVRADITIPEAKLTASMTIEKNSDATLPASHTITWRFKRDEGSPLPAFSEAGMLLMRDEGNPQGQALAGVPARITPNDYIIALAAPEALLNANLDTIKRRGWFDLPLKMAGGLQAKITLEKGNPGERLIAQAFERWGHNETAAKETPPVTAAEPAQSEPKSE